MKFNEYQDQAIGMAVYPNRGSNIVYPALGLAGESGEAVDKVKKIWRNRGLMAASDYTDDECRELAKELGDVLWYIAAMAVELGYTLEDIAQMNIDKLLDRRARNVIASSGDNR